jgi:molecular chaperone GrpE
MNDDPNRDSLPDDLSVDAAAARRVEVGREVPSAPERPASHDEPEQRLGVLEIVEAFTALRHELKLQVRGGRDLQTELADRFQRLEQELTQQTNVLAKMATTGAGTSSGASDDEARQLAEVVAELEESLQRAIEALADSLSDETVDAEPRGAMEQHCRTAPWFVRVFARGWLAELQEKCQADVTTDSPMQNACEQVRRGLELLLQRVHRQMRQCEIERLNVLHQPFDANAMRAIDVVDHRSVPSGHVVDQLRPAYRRKGKIFRYAEVRVAK